MRQRTVQGDAACPVQLPHPVPCIQSCSSSNALSRTATPHHDPHSDQGAAISAPGMRRDAQRHMPRPAQILHQLWRVSARACGPRLHVHPGGRLRRLGRGVDVRGRPAVAPHPQHPLRHLPPARMGLTDQRTPPLPLQACAAKSQARSCLAKICASAQISMCSSPERQLGRTPQASKDA